MSISQNIIRSAILTLLFVLFFSCRTTKETQTIVKTDTIFVEKLKYEYIKITDTFRIIELPFESSINISTDTVYAETSLAWGYAFTFMDIDDEFFIGLKIQNKPNAKLPVRVEEKYIYIKDTSNSKASNISSETREIIEKRNVLSLFLEISGGIFWFLIIFFLLYKIAGYSTYKR